MCMENLEGTFPSVSIQKTFQDQLRILILGAILEFSRFAEAPCIPLLFCLLSKTFSCQYFHSLLTPVAETSLQMSILVFIAHSGICTELFSRSFCTPDVRFFQGNYNSHLIDFTIRDSYLYSTQSCVSLANSCYLLESLIPKSHSANTLSVLPALSHFLISMKSPLKLH